MRKIILSLLFLVLSVSDAYGFYTVPVYKKPKPKIVTKVVVKKVKVIVPKIITKIVYIKPKIKPVPLRYVTVKGNVNIKQLVYLIQSEVDIPIELSGSSKKKSYVDFNDARLSAVLNYIKHVYYFNYSYNYGTIGIFNFETREFKLPIIPLSNTVTASLGTSSTGAASGAGGMTGGASPSGAAGGAGMTGGTGTSSSGTSLGGSVSESVSNIDTPFYKTIFTTIKGSLSKKGKIMFSSRYGIMYVSDYVRNIQGIKKYIRSIKKRMSKIILLKLKIIDVELSSGYEYGINWNNLYSDMGHYLGAASSLGVNLSNTPSSSTLTGSDQITFNSGIGTNAVISALGNFGKINIMNEAKLEVLNGQTRTINNMETETFLEGEVASVVGVSTVSTGIPQLTPEFGTANQGISVVFTPTLYKKDYVIASIQLVLNTIAGINSYTLSGNSFNIPIVSTKSVSFSAKIKSGESAIIGGLYYIDTEKNSEGVPVLMNIPLIGDLFKGVSYSKTHNELFLLVTPVIVKKTIKNKGVKND
jgi:type II secretory pathway component GspD/PulD (secretin)